MESLTLLELAFAALVVVAGYAVRGTAGFGGQAVAVPLLALVLPLTMVIPAIAVLTVLASLGHLRRGWGKIAWNEFARVIPYTVIGVLAGLYLLYQLDVRTLTRAFGAFVILYAGFVLATASRPVRLPARFLHAAGAVLSACAGAAGTVFGGAAGTLYVVYLNSVRLDKDSFRVTISTILMVQAILRVMGYAHLGLYDHNAPILIAAGLPLVVLGSRIGEWLAGRLDQRRFNLGVGLVLFASGAALLFK